jgi:hypothetical protein
MFKLFKDLFLNVLMNQFEEGEGGGEPPVEPESYQVGDNSYTADQITEAFESHNNMQSWNQKNTQESQRLSEERAQLSKMKELNEMLETNPDLYDKVQEAFDNHFTQQQQPQPGQAQPAQVSPEILNAIRDNKQQMQSMQEQLANTQLEKDFTALEAKFPEAFQEEGYKQKLAKFAIDNNILNIEHAHKAMNYDSYATQKLNEGEQMAKEGFRKKRQIATPGGSKSKSDSGYSIKKKDGSTKSWDEIEADMVADLKNNTE